MNYTTFETLTVRQYQQLYEIHTSEGDPLDKAVQSVCILANKTEAQVEEMPLPEFNKVSAELSVIFSRDFKAKPKTFIQISGQRYGIIYKPSSLSAGQYIEIQTWMRSNLIENMNKIMASLVYLVTGFGIFKRRHKYNAADHVRISEAILDCNFQDVNSACVFFLKLWRDSISSLGGYLEKELLSKGMKKEQIQMILKHASDGFLTPNELQILRT